MIKVIFLIVILYIIIQNLLENNAYENNNNNVINIHQPSTSQKLDNNNLVLSDINKKVKNNKQQNINYDKPNPWTRIIVHENEDYPYHFHIKLKIPSLNDYNNWKEIIPNLNFNVKSGELIIPSKDEPSALAIANLICINFLGQITLAHILEKNLIQISINKCKNYEMVQNKIREQIHENLYGTTHIKTNNNFEQDLFDTYNSNKKKSNKIDFINTNIIKEQNSSKVKNTNDLDDSIKKSTFKDTFENFSENTINNNSIEPYDGFDYSYL